MFHFYGWRVQRTDRCIARIKLRAFFWARSWGRLFCWFIHNWFNNNIHIYILISRRKKTPHLARCVAKVVNQILSISSRIALAFATAFLSKSSHSGSAFDLGFAASIFSLIHCVIDDSAQATDLAPIRRFRESTWCNICINGTTRFAGNVHYCCNAY